MYFSDRRIICCKCRRHLQKFHKSTAFRTSLREICVGYTKTALLVSMPKVLGASTPVIRCARNNSDKRNRQQASVRDRTTICAVTLRDNRISTSLRACDVCFACRARSELFDRDSACRARSTNTETTTQQCYVKLFKYSHAATSLVKNQVHHMNETRDLRKRSQWFCHKFLQQPSMVDKTGSA